VCCSLWRDNDGLNEYKFDGFGFSRASTLSSVRMEFRARRKNWNFILNRQQRKRFVKGENLSFGSDSERVLIKLTWIFALFKSFL
jgi:hypothetical protein